MRHFLRRGPYFNEVVGGPEHGHEHMLGSSISWGQDLLHLKEWFDAHPEARPLRVALYGSVEPQMVGIDFSRAKTSAKRGDPSGENARPNGSHGLWYAVDINYLHSDRHKSFDSRTLRQAGDVDGPVAYFRSVRPTARIGYSIYIYRITDGETGRLRRWDRSTSD